MLQLLGSEIEQEECSTVYTTTVYMTGHDSTVTTKHKSDTKLGAHTDIDGESHPLPVLHGFCTSTSDSTRCLKSDLLFHY